MHVFGFGVESSLNWKWKIDAQTHDRCRERSPRSNRVTDCHLGSPVGGGQGGFEVDFADLAQIALSFMDEPNHPRLRQYTKQHTLDWSVRVDAAG